jgi:hypothetical protein
MGYQLTEHTPADAPIGPELDEFEAIIVPIRPRALDPAFEIIHQINAWRFSPAAGSLAPEVILLAVGRLPAGTIADLRGQCCRIIYDSPGHLADELEVVGIERQRLRHKGVLLLFVNVADSIPTVLLIGANGQRAEMDLNGREARLLRKLGSERRAFHRAELAEAVRCKQDQIKVYIERIKAEYDTRRRKLGVLTSKDDFIKNPGHGLGYRLHARIKTILP